jgi:sulfatase maturation enzyme AslB (radical SAM superfamily)
MPWSEAREQIEPWLERFDLEAFGFMGGEPLINPDLRAWLIGIRDLMPDTQIRFITNGLLLERHWWVVDLLDQLGNSVLKISKHVKDPRIDSAIDKVFSGREWTAVTEYGIDRWRSPSGFRFQIASPTRFLKTFQGEYHDMRPHDNDIKDAFDICVQQRCPLLYQGRLYKCGTAGLTPDILKRYGTPNADLWQHYLSSGLGADCSDHDLDSFIGNFGKPHAICRQCPSTKDHRSMLDHTKTVKFK